MAASARRPARAARLSLLRRRGLEPGLSRRCETRVGEHPGLSGACYRLGPGDLRAVCGQGGSPKLVDEVETAIDLVVQRSPQLFDKTDVAAPNTDLYRVVDSEGYLDAVAQTLRVIGVCAQRPRRPRRPASAATHRTRRR